MLREVRRKFDIAPNVTAMPGDIVDVSAWKNAGALERTGYLIPTKATKATISAEIPAQTPPPTNKDRRALRRRYKSSALGSRPRVFTRKAKQGD